jgi:hypothetical protein
MSRDIRIFSSFDEADRADAEYYASLTPQECLDIQLDLIAAYREATGANEFVRVCRVIRLEGS